MPPKEKEKIPEDKNKKQAPKRQKIVKACKDCRRRKVKCDGELPCATCRRSSIQCVFESSPPKRNGSKQYIEVLENKINLMEKALTTLSGPTQQLVKEAMLRQQHLLEEQRAQDHTVQQGNTVKKEPENEDPFLLGLLGEASYIPEISEMDTSAFQTYRTQDTYSTPSASPKSVASNSRFPNEDDMIEKEKIQKHLNYYFTYIQPVFPLFVPNHFTAQYNTQKIPIILIYAMCAVAAHFEDGSGQGYYSKAWLMLDEAVGHPCLALVQTLLLLIKYVEVGEPTIVGFFEKAKSLMARVIEMCKVLKLHQFERVTSPDPPESETRKRTFCMVYTYDTFLCVEHGIDSDFQHLTDCSNFLPTADHSMLCLKYTVKFCSTLSQIHSHIRRVTTRQDIQKDMRNDDQIADEHLALLCLQNRIEQDYLQLPASLTYGSIKPSTFPADDISTNISPSVRLLHMIYHLNVILLHFHYFCYPLPKGSQELSTYAHRNLCAASSSNMIRLVEGLMRTQDQSYRFAPRGIQFVAHCITAARSVLECEMTHSNDVKSSKMYPDEYQRCMQACHTIASLSPSNEMRSYARESDMSVINQQLANDVSCLSVNTLDQSPGTSASTSPSPVQQQQHQLCHASSHQQQQQQQFAFAYGNPPMMNSIYSNSNPTLSTEFVAQTTPVKARRNTISERPRVSTFPSNNVMNFPPVPPAYLQLSSQDIPNANSFFMHSPHQPLHNIHATPLTIHQPPQRSLMRSHLRGPSQSCTDLRAMSRAHKKMPPLPQQPQTPSPQQSPQQQQFIGNAYTQYRSPESIMSNSTVSTAPYGSFHGAGSTSSRGSHSISSNLPYGRIPGMGNDMLPRTIPIAPPASSQSSGYQRQNNNNGSHKMRIRKSTSSLGLSNIRQQHQHQQQQQQQYQLYQQQQYIQQQMISANSNGNSMGGFTSESSTSPIPNYEAPQHSRRHTVPYGENSLENMLDINSNPHRSYQPSLIDYNDLSLNIKLPELMDTPMDEDYSIYDVPPIGDDIQRTEGQLH